jgi:hypothetical protein
MGHTLGLFRRPSSLIIDRGPTPAPDKTYSDFTHDGTPYSIDLSGIVPVGAKWVMIQCVCLCPTIPGAITFFMNSRGQDYTDFSAGGPGGGIPLCLNGKTRIDPDRQLGYMSELPPDTTILFVVQGWIT